MAKPSKANESSWLTPNYSKQFFEQVKCDLSKNQKTKTEPNNDSLYILLSSLIMTPLKLQNDLTGYRYYQATSDKDLKILIHRFNYL